MQTFGSPTWPLKISTQIPYTFLSPVVSPSGRWLVKGDGQKKANLWDLSAASVVDSSRSFEGDSDVFHAAFSFDERWLITGWRDARILVWDLRNVAADPIVLAGHTGAVRDIAVSPDDRWIVSKGHRAGPPDSREGEVCFWRLDKIETERRPVDRQVVDSFDWDTNWSFSPDGKWFLAWGCLGHLWDLSQDTPQDFSPRREGYDVSFAAFDGSGKRLIRAVHKRHDISPYSGYIEICNLVSREGIVSVETIVDYRQMKEARGASKEETLREGRLNGLAVGKDGAWLAAQVDDITVVAHLGTAGNRGAFTRIEELIYADVHTSLDDNVALIATSTDDICVFDPNANAHIRMIRAAPGPDGARAYPVKISQDGQWFLRGNRLWQRHADRFVLWGDLPTNAVHSAWFCPAADRLVTTGLDGEVLVWDLGYERLLQLGRRAAGRDLTPEERQAIRMEASSEEDRKSSAPHD